MAGSAAPGGTEAPAPGGSTPPGTDVGADAAFAGPGPYVAGTTTLDMGGRAVEVWYPADPGSEVGASKRIFEIRDLLPETLKSIVPDDLNPKYETNAYVEIPASDDGPFPLVLFAHGFGAYPTEYQTILTHLASWGFVVAGPGLRRARAASRRSRRAAAVTPRPRRSIRRPPRRRPQTRVADEAAIMSQARELLAAEGTKAGGLLEGIVDATNVGTAGHSAGVTSAVAAAATDPNVKTFVAMSGGRAPGAHERAAHARRAGHGDDRRRGPDRQPRERRGVLRVAERRRSAWSSSTTPATTRSTTCASSAPTRAGC